MMMVASRHNRFVSLLPMIFGAFIAAGCAGVSTIGDVESWMEEVKRETKPSVKPLPEPVEYVPVAYQPIDGVEPFNFARLAQALGLSNASSSALFNREQARVKEPLEAYPLDAVAYVGMLEKAGVPVALIRVEDKLYQIRVGQYMGTNFGRVTQITEGQITLREVAEDATGEWVERTTTLDLNEETK